jgi:hypothetical protein
MKTNICPYNQVNFSLKFIKTQLYQQLVKDFHNVEFKKLFSNDDFPTPRQLYATQRFTAVPFYYLEFLTQKNPTVIYDLGCGWNIFKKYIPNIIGVGAENPKDIGFCADVHDYVDDNYIAEHQNFFESVFSINALHFIPLSSIQKRVLDFYSMIRPNGTGWLSLNLQRMLERDTENFEGYSLTQLDNYVRDQLYDLNVNYKVFDVDLTVIDECMDGNIRLVMEK